MTKLERLLLDLGSTADEVAETLRIAGIRGQRSRHYNCPVAKYLRVQTGTLYAVSSEAVLQLEYQKNAEVPMLPPAVRDFVCQFDAGAFDDLALVDE